MPERYDEHKDRLIELGFNAAEKVIGTIPEIFKETSVGLAIIGGISLMVAGAVGVVHIIMWLASGVR